MMKSLLIVAATTTVASANTIDLFATSSWDSSSYLIGAAGGPDYDYTGQYVQATSGMDTLVHPDGQQVDGWHAWNNYCLLYTSPSPRDRLLSRMPSSA